ASELLQRLNRRHRGVAWAGERRHQPGAGRGGEHAPPHGAGDLAQLLGPVALGRRVWCRLHDDALGDGVQQRTLARVVAVERARLGAPPGGQPPGRQRVPAAPLRPIDPPPPYLPPPAPTPPPPPTPNHPPP